MPRTAGQEEGELWHRLKGWGSCWGEGPEDWFTEVVWCLGGAEKNLRSQKKEVFHVLPLTVTDSVESTTLMLGIWVSRPISLPLGKAPSG